MTFNNNTMEKLTFDEYVAAMVTIQFKRKNCDCSLGQLKKTLELNDGDIDMKKVCNWIESNDYAAINYSKHLEEFNFMIDGGTTLGTKGEELVKNLFER